MLMSSTHDTPFEIKGGLFTLTALRLRVADVNAIEAALAVKIRSAPAFFQHAPIVIDVSELHEALDLTGLLAMVRDHGLLPVAVQGGNEELQAQAVRARLGLLSAPKAQRRAGAEHLERDPTPPEQAPSTSPESKRRGPVPSVPGGAGPAKTVVQPVRSGQQIYAPGGDLVVIAAVNRDAEVLADGNIHVYGSLRGKALAGVKGAEGARIFAREMDPQLVAVAGVYRVIEALEAEVKGKPAQVFLRDGRLMMEGL
jgi:septum site-determining protein MinC